METPQELFQNIKQDNFVGCKQGVGARKINSQEGRVQMSDLSYPYSPLICPGQAVKLHPED